MIIIFIWECQQSSFPSTIHSLLIHNSPGFPGGFQYLILWRLTENIFLHFLIPPNIIFLVSVCKEPRVTCASLSFACLQKLIESACFLLIYFCILLFVLSLSFSLVMVLLCWILWFYCFLAMLQAFSVDLIFSLALILLQNLSMRCLSMSCWIFSAFSTHPLCFKYRALCWTLVFGYQ